MDPGANAKVEIIMSLFEERTQRSPIFIKLVYISLVSIVLLLFANTLRMFVNDHYARLSTELSRFN